jgi:NADH-quinone oxidoreductase subunit J
MPTALFWTFVAIMLFFGVMVVVNRNPVASAMSLVVCFLGLAALYISLDAFFLGVIQILVYAGAVMVLYVFVVAYVGGEGETIGERLHAGITAGGPLASRLRTGGALVGAALLTELLIALLGTGLKAIDGYGAPYTPGPRTFGTPAYIGNLLLTRFLVVFEIASFLLLVAAVGGVVLARRRGGIDEGEDEEISPIDVPRPRLTGTTAEAVGAPAGAANGAARAVNRAGGSGW